LGSLVSGFILVSVFLLKLVGNISVLVTFGSLIVGGKGFMVVIDKEDSLNLVLQ